MENRVKRLHHCTFIALVVVVLHLNLFSSSPDGERTLYITPSSSIQCHSEPCLTLSQFTKTSSSLLSPLNTTLIFSAGNHTLDTELFITNISTFSLLKNSANEGTHAVIVCQDQANFIFDHVNEVSICEFRFIGCGSNEFSSLRNITIENSTFQGQNDSGTALNIMDTNLTIVNSTFIANRIGTCMDIFDANIESNVPVRIGGAILVSNSNISIIKCNFLESSAEIGGAMYIYDLSNVSIINSTFVNNQAMINTHIQDCLTNNSISETVCFGGAIITVKSWLSIDGCTFTNNTSLCGGGGALFIQHKSVAKIRKSEFESNRANGSGGAIFVAMLSTVTINSSVFLMNSANQGGVLYIDIESKITGRECVYENNTAKLSGGVTTVDQLSLFHDHNSQFYNNKAKLGGVLYAVRSEVILSDSGFSYNQATESGGVIYVLQSQQNVGFFEQCNLTHNSAGTGGAIYAVESVLYVANGQVLSIKLNTANDSGGGVYLYRSTLSSGYASMTNISCNKAKGNGGGVHAINSMIVSTQSYRKGSGWPFQTLTFFTNNSANKGGGLYMESAAQLRLQKVNNDIHLSEDKLNTSIYFTSNSAQYGSAIYVADETYFDVCGGDHSTINSTVTDNAECFVQVFSETTVLSEKSSAVSIEFSINDSNSSIGSTIVFGGLLDRCIPDQRAEIFANGYVQYSKGVDGITYLELISDIKINDTEYISSLPVRVCFCTPDNQPDCSYEPPIVHVKKGENFNVLLVTVDQVNHTLKNIEIYSSLSHTESSLDVGETTQVTGNACTNLTFSIYSPYASEELILYAEGPCRNASRSQSRVHIVSNLAHVQ